MSKVALKYHFTFPDSRERTFELELDRDTAELTSPTDPNPPAWTELGFHQCTGCPCEKSKVSHCPAAVHLSTVIDGSPASAAVRATRTCDGSPLVIVTVRPPAGAGRSSAVP